MTDRHFDQIWQITQTGASPAGDGRDGYLDIRQITGITPLGDHPGTSGGDVPEALHAALFGQPASGPELHSYALLDAGRIPGLPELLETSRLDHLCLFRGERDGVGATAPWLVRLKESDKFTRNLFRQSSRAWHLWGKDCGIFLRSDAEMAALSDHFRRFTRIRDRQGRIVFFRFWDPLVAGTYFPGVGHDPDRIGAFFTLTSGQQISIIAQSGPDTAIIMTPCVAPDQGQRRPAPVFDELEEALFTEIAFRIFARQLSDWLVTEYPDQLGKRPAADLQAISAHVIAAGRRAGLEMKEEFAFLAQMMMTSGGWFLDDATPPGLRQLIIDAAHPKAQAMAEGYAGRQTASLQGQLYAQWPEVRDYLVELPADEAVTPARFREFASRFLRLSAAGIPDAIASTRARLRTLGLGDQHIEGRAVVLSLLLGPRFFEDPLKPWSGQPVEAAINTAWQLVTE